MGIRPLREAVRAQLRLDADASPPGRVLQDGLNGFLKAEVLKQTCKTLERLSRQDKHWSNMERGWHWFLGMQSSHHLPKLLRVCLRALELGTSMPQI